MRCRGRHIFHQLCESWSSSKVSSSGRVDVYKRQSMDDRLQTFLEKYTALSGRLTLETVDPVMHLSLIHIYCRRSG